MWLVFLKIFHISIRKTLVYVLSLLFVSRPDFLIATSSKKIESHLLSYVEARERIAVKQGQTVHNTAIDSFRNTAEA